MTSSSTAAPPAADSRLSTGGLAVTRHLPVHGPATRGHLSDLLRVVPASMSRPVRSLVEDGIVAETAEPVPVVREDVARNGSVRPDDAARALGHLAATFAGALRTTRIVLAGEDIAAIAGSPAMAEAVADRLRPGPRETQRCSLDITVAPLTSSDRAQGAAVAGIPSVLGALDRPAPATTEGTR